MAHDNIQLGQLIDPLTKPQRDAIHIAVMPIQTNWSDFKPAQPIHIDAKREAHRVDDTHPQNAIIDPFLKESTGFDRVWVWAVLLPNTVIGMRHHWLHQTIPDSDGTVVDANMSEAERYLREAAGVVGRNFERFIYDLDDYFEDSGNYIHMGENEDYKNLDWSVVWEHYKTFKGVELRDGLYCPYLCSC